jgi:hypothetical protein
LGATGSISTVTASAGDGSVAGRAGAGRAGAPVSACSGGGGCGRAVVRVEAAGVAGGAVPAGVGGRPASVEVSAGGPASTRPTPRRKRPTFEAPGGAASPVPAAGG